jgi:hypothetical protein
MHPGRHGSGIHTESTQRNRRDLAAALLTAHPLVTVRRSHLDSTSVLAVLWQEARGRAKQDQAGRDPAGSGEPGRQQRPKGS